MRRFIHWSEVLLRQEFQGSGNVFLPLTLFAHIILIFQSGNDAILFAGRSRYEYQSIREFSF